MKFPCLVPKHLCKTDIHVELDVEAYGNLGLPLEPVVFNGKCNYQDSAKTILTDEKKLVQISGIALFPGDIAPDLPTLNGGTVVVNGETRRILKGTKARNVDGTVNYSKLELI